MNLFGAALGRLGYLPELRVQTLVTQAVQTALQEDRKRRFVGKRAFEGAKTGRLNAGWTTETTNLNYNISRDLRVLRARSRQMARDNDYVKQFLRMVKTNVVGVGMSLQVQSKDIGGALDERANTQIEDAFWDWSRPGQCDVTGRLSFAALQRLAIEIVARDGEVLIQEVPLGPYGYQLRLIDPALMDETMNRDNGGNRVRMGVELNDMMMPVAYWIRANDDPLRIGYAGGKHTRIPAADTMHLYLVDDVDQIRGVPWMHTIGNRAHQLHGFEEAAVVAARVGASKMGFYTSPEGDLSPIAGDAESDGELVEEAEAGHFTHLPPGFDFKEFSPDYPHQNYGAFVKSCLRGISAGLGVSYNSLANDLEGVNYSSIRAGVLEEREIWKSVQEWMIDSFHSRVYSRWLNAALISKLNLPSLKFEKFNNARWQARRWDWVDPAKDVAAKREEIAEGLTSRSRVMREKGVDPEEVWRELEYEKKRLDGLITPMTPAPAGVSVSGDPNAQD